MFRLTPDMTFYLCYGDMDLRQGICSLVESLRAELGREPAMDEVFIFPSRDRRNFQILHHSAGGYMLYHKRKSFHFLLPAFDDDTAEYELSREDLLSMLQGAVCKRLFIM